MINETITKTVTFYDLEWQHPETGLWCSLYESIPTPTKKALTETLSQYQGVKRFIDLAPDLERLQHLGTRWRVAPKPGTQDSISLQVVGDKDYIIEMPDGEQYRYGDIDELLYSWIIEDIFGLSIV